MSDNIIIFKTEDEKISVDVRFGEETVWLTIDQMAVLFDKSRSTINEHILNIYMRKESLPRKRLRGKSGIPIFLQSLRTAMTLT